MKDRLKNAALTIAGFVLIGLWLGLEFKLFKIPRLSEETRLILSWPLRIAGMAILSAIFFLPFLALAEWTTDKLEVLKRLPEQKRHWPAYAIGAILSVWSGYSVVFGEVSPEGNIDEKRAILDAKRRETKADLFRQKAECQAYAIEFGRHTDIVNSCLEDRRVAIEQSKQTFAAIDKRERELDAAECKAFLIKAKESRKENSSGFTFVPDVCATPSAE